MANPCRWTTGTPSPPRLTRQRTVCPWTGTSSSTQPCSVGTALTAARASGLDAYGGPHLVEHAALALAHPGGTDAHEATLLGRLGDRARHGDHPPAEGGGLVGGRRRG